MSATKVIQAHVELPVGVVGELSVTVNIEELFGLLPRMPTPRQAEVRVESNTGLKLALGIPEKEAMSTVHALRTLAQDIERAAIGYAEPEKK